MSRDSYHHGDLKAAILGQAAVLVAERGADGISLRELARAAGVSHAAPAVSALAAAARWAYRRAIGILPATDAEPVADPIPA